MSAGYNSGLSEYPNKGKLNLIESEDPEDVLQSKVDQLVKLIEQAKSIVFHTGAGISTSTGIPDFRGPKGVWTLESQVNIYTYFYSHPILNLPSLHPNFTFSRVKQWKKAINGKRQSLHILTCHWSL